MNRRDLLSGITQLFSLVFSLLLGMPLVRFFCSSLETPVEKEWHPLLKTEAKIPSNGFVRVPFKRMVQDGWKRRFVEQYVWVRNKEDGSYMVLDPHCTHLGCALSWNEEGKQFLCPCHGGKFDLNGERIAGPPLRPLDRYETRVENNILKIGKLLKKE